MKKRNREGGVCSPGRVMGMAFAFLCLIFGMIITEAEAPVETKLPAEMT